MRGSAVGAARDPQRGCAHPEVEHKLQAAALAIRLGPPVVGTVEDGGVTRLRVERPDGSSAVYLVIDDGAADEPYAPTFHYGGSAQHVRTLTELVIRVVLGLPPPAKPS